MRPIEERELRARTGHCVPVEEVIGGHVILIDTLLRETHAKGARVEANVLGSRTRNRGDVVKPGEGARDVRILRRLSARKRGRIHGFLPAK
jgi:hypothetical protein